ncbi:hypothetical protein [Arthrobacter sp. NyZ413]|uniref:hypothetical protein n=1 Tax=Arthrobacter sp. NyZ413 TaxID=3144669 RepID=UPI003BF89E04
MTREQRIVRHLEGQRRGAVRWLAWTGVVLMAAAALLWFLAGGRDEFVAEARPATWRVLVPATAFWLAWLMWLVAAVLFGARMFRSIIGRLDDTWTGPGKGGRASRKRGP